MWHRVLGRRCIDASNLVWSNQPANLGSGLGECPGEWVDSLIVADPLFCDPATTTTAWPKTPLQSGKGVMGAFRVPGCGPKAPAAASPWGQVGRRDRE